MEELERMKRTILKEAVLISRNLDPYYDYVLANLVICRSRAIEEGVFKPLLLLQHASDLCGFWHFIICPSKSVSLMQLQVISNLEIYGY